MTTTSASAFARVDTIRPEGLDLYFGDGYYGLRPRQHISARGARLAFALADIARLEGIALHFGDNYFDPRHRLFWLRILKNLRSPPLRTLAKRGLGQGRLASLCASSLDRRSKAESRRHCILYFDYINCDEE